MTRDNPPIARSSQRGKAVEGVRRVAPERSAGWPLGPIHHDGRSAVGADQPDSISHVRDIVPRRDVGTIKAPLASRANRVGPTDKSGAEAFDFVRLEPFGHVNEISRVCFESAIFELGILRISR